MDDIQKSGSRLGSNHYFDMIPSQWTKEGFMMRFDQLLSTSKTYMDAYLIAEKEHTTIFGCQRYKNYEAFRQVRRAFLNKRIKCT